MILYREDSQDPVGCLRIRVNEKIARRLERGKVALVYQKQGMWKMDSDPKRNSIDWLKNYLVILYRKDATDSLEHVEENVARSNARLGSSKSSFP